MKYKIIGVLDVLLSTVYLISQIGLVFFVYPKMYQLYTDFSAQLPFTTRYFYPISVSFMLLYFLFLIAGIWLLKSPSPKLFTFVAIAVTIMVIFSGYFIAMSVLGVVGPLYNLSSSM